MKSANDAVIGFCLLCFCFGMCVGAAYELGLIIKARRNAAVRDNYVVHSSQERR